MLVVMDTHATPQHLEQVLRAIREMALTPHPMPGATRTAIGITGNVSAIDSRPLEVLPGVAELIRVTKPYKLASREMRSADTVIPISPLRRVGLRPARTRPTRSKQHMGRPEAYPTEGAGI